MKKIIILFSLTMVLNSCYNDKYTKLYPPVVTNTNTCDTTTITYTHDVLPILNTYCNSCHGAGGSANSNADYSNWSGVNQTALGGTLLNDINWPSSVRHQMPQGGTKLSDCDINKISRWVHLGALNN